MTKFKSIISFGALSMLIMASINAPSYAKKFIGKDAISLGWSACLAESDRKTAENNTHVACCSKEAGICIRCPKAGGGACDIINHITRPDLLLRDKSIDPGKSKMSPSTNGTTARTPKSDKEPNQKLSK